MTIRDSSEDAPRPERPIAITPAGIAGTIVLAVVVAVCIRLGFWQLARLEQRRTSNTAVAARLDQPPMGDIAALTDTTGLSYRVAAASGRYDNERYLVLPGRSFKGVPGVYLLMPLRLDGRSDAVLVNRGWVPSPDAATINARDFAVTRPVKVQGLVLPFPGREQSLAQRESPARTDTFMHVLYRIDENALRAQFPYPMLDVMLQRIGAPGEPRYPTALPPPPLDEGPHLGYAIQWFSFALIGVIGWFALVLRQRMPRAGTAAALAALATFAMPSAGSAQLRPLDPLEWRVFDQGVVFVGGIGGGVLLDHPAPLAGTRGTLLEIGSYSLAYRSSRIAIELGGTALWRLTENDSTQPAVAVVEPADGVRQDAGPAFASTAVRVSPDSWPVDLVLRFGGTIPTTSNESGLDRDRTDFFALFGVRYRRKGLTLTAENGVGINGTMRPGLPQSDVWTYAFGATYDLYPIVLAADFVGRQDGHSYVIRGNEDIRELRAGFDLGRARWLRVRYIRGMAEDASPAHGLRISAGLLLTDGK
ncbi:MAG TPA: SURF1 family protein [Longimicrobiales bacterium]|nr:SURF1 family protein [Longimicrobiales bacterium]